MCVQEFTSSCQLASELNVARYIKMTGNKQNMFCDIDTSFVNGHKKMLFRATILTQVFNTGSTLYIN